MYALSNDERRVEVARGRVSEVVVWDRERQDQVV